MILIEPDTRFVAAGPADFARRWNFDNLDLDDLVFQGSASATAVVMTGQTTSILLGGPPGASGATGDEFWRIAFAVDVDADQVTDLVWTDGAGKLAVNLTVIDPGGMTFSAPATVLPGLVGTGRALLASADLDGDGRSDLILRDLVTGEVSWRRTGTSFGSLGLSTLSGGPLGFAWMLEGTGDLNNDGRDDLLWRHADGQVVAWLANANGTISAAILPRVGHEWRVEAVARLNAGDTGTDVLWRNVLTGMGLIWQMSAGGPVQIAGTTYFGNIAPDRSFYSVRYRQPSPNAPDLSAHVDWLAGDDIFSAALGTTGAMVAETRIRFRNAGADPLKPQIQQAFDFAARDNNVGGRSMRAMRTHHFGTVGGGAGNAGRVPLWNATLGRLELLSSNGSSLQSFAPPPPVVGNNAVSLGNSIILGMGDFNSDGVAMDLVTSYDQGSYWVYLWNGSSYTPAGSGFLQSSSEDARLVAIGNIDGVAGDETIFSNGATGLGWGKWDASGITTTGSLGFAPVGQIVQGAADLDGNGRDDIVFRNAVTGAVSYWSIGSSRVVEAFTPINTTPVTLEWDLVGFADLDADLDDDIIWRRNTDGFTVAWTMQNGALAAVDGIAAPGWDWRLEGTSDLNGDGRGDLVWRNASGQYAAYLMNGATVGSIVTSAVMPFDRLTVGWTQAISR